jgi:hypothetical protein
MQQKLQLHTSYSIPGVSVTSMKPLKVLWM